MDPTGYENERFSPWVEFHPENGELRQESAFLGQIY